MALLLLDKEGKEKAKKIQKQYTDYQEGITDAVKPEEDESPGSFEEEKVIDNAMQARLDAINVQLDSMFKELKELLNESVALAEALGH